MEEQPQQQPLLDKGTRRPFRNPTPGKWRNVDRVSSMLECLSTGFLRCFDEWVGTLIMLGLSLYSVAVMSFWVKRLLYDDIFLKRDVKGLEVTRFANDVAGTATYLLTALLWHTLCFKCAYVHNFWKFKSKWAPSLVPGGFIPRPSAFSMGLLLFVSGNLVSSKLVLGGDLVKDGWNGPLSSYDSCRADSIETHMYGGFGPVPGGWFQRFYRAEPIGCFNVGEMNLLGFNLGYGSWAESFTDLLDYSSEKNASNIPGLVHPVDHKTNTTDFSRFCAYQCSKYMAVSFKGLISSVGAIFAGAAIVVTVSDYFSTRIGWKLVDKDTTPEEIFHLVTGARFPAQAMELTEDLKSTLEGFQPVFHRYPGSQTLAAFHLIVVQYLAKCLAPRVTIDGYYTVDYYTTVTLLFSLMCAVMIRSWNPFTGRTIFFTRKMWTEGQDDFLEFSEKKKKFVKNTYDMYEWFHLDHCQRWVLLFHHCRALSDDQIDDLYDYDDLKTDEHKKNKEDELKDNSWTALLCRLMANIGSCVCLILQPHKLCCPAPPKGEKATEHLKVVTFAEINVQHEEHRKAQDPNDGEIGFWTYRQNIKLNGGVHGVVTRKSQVAGEVIVKFSPEDNDGCGSKIGSYLDSAGGDTDIPLETEVHEYSVPMAALMESSSEWAVIRHWLKEDTIKAYNRESTRESARG